MQASRSLLLRWSWRDLRHRWGSVVVIASIIAIGTGVFAGLGSTARWREMSNDASFRALRMHDLRVSLSPGTYVPEGTLADLAGRLPAGTVAGVEERLLVPTQVDASTAGQTILVPGRLVGTDLGSDASVDALDLDRGALPSSGGAPTQLVLEQKFADHYGLPPGGTAVLSGGRTVSYTGLGVTPEYFLVTGESDTSFLAEANFAALFGSLDDVQRLGGLEGQVNDAAIRLVDGADRDAVAAALEELVDGLPGTSATVSTRDEETSYRLLYDDIEGDQQVWNVLSALVLLAASLAAFNLIGRIVDSQRREIGVQMALGVPPRRIAARPLLVGAQIALLGTLLGAVAGLLVGAGMRRLMVDLLPLPVWRTPFQPGVFVVAASLGFVLPFVASALPVRRAVRVEPVEAIRTAHQPAKGRSLVRLSQRVRVPGGSLAQLPLRNVLRSPRRTVLTALGVGAAIAALVGVFGMLDSFRATIERGDRELTQEVPDRVTVQLDGLVAASGPEVAAIAGSPTVARADTSLEVPATVRADDRSDPIDLLVTVADLEQASWTPTVERRAAPGGRPGIVLAREAAADLGVEPGDVVVVRHPALDPSGGLTQADTPATVVGLHPSPLRALAFVDIGDADELGIPPVVNRADVYPAVGVTTDEVRRAMFETPGVASAQPISAITGVFDEALAQFMGFLALTAGAVLVMALLVALNSTSISVDERTREHATLFAFGLPVRRVVWTVVKESAMVGLLATLIGVGLGYLLVHWMVGSIVSRTVPDFGFDVVIRPTTVVIAFVIGVAAVALTPLLTARRMRRMDIPDALRVME